MFSVNRFDPRKEDARKNASSSTTDKRKKKTKSRNKDGQDEGKKKKKKRKKDLQPASGDDNDAKQNHRDGVGASSSAPITAAETTPVIIAEKVSETNSQEQQQESLSNAPLADNAVADADAAAEPVPEASFRVIAPETDGALSSKKNLTGKITAEAFDDLDLTDDAWLASSSSSLKKDPATKEQRNDGDDENDDDSASPIDFPSSTFDPSDEIERALEMTRLPIVEAARRWGMADFLVRNLISNGHEHFFPIQALVIPDVIVAERHMTSLRIRDICCAAPTGSGKTLAFVLPVLNALAARKVRRLRALVILPSRDLAQQVYEVFDDYKKGSKNDLQIGLAIGQTDFQAEQKRLIFGDDEENVNDKNWTQLRNSLDPGNIDLAFDVMRKQLGNYNVISGQTKNWDSNNRTPRIPAGGISAVDVLVCTPGRLVDHLDNTPGFTLQHLRWLVIDEADRLLSQSFHGWIQRVLDCVHASPTPSSQIIGEDRNKDEGADMITIDPITHRRSEHDPFVTRTTRTNDNISSAAIGSPSNISQRIQLRKLLYSATLTKDPQKLSSLRLVNPKYFNAHDLKRRQNKTLFNKESDFSANGSNKKLEGSLYRMPEQLKECTVECTAEQKPIVLLALILERLKEYRELEESAVSSLSEKPKKNTIVVFASSLESTHRLTRLLQLLWQAADYGTTPVEFSSALNQHQRSKLMKCCNDPNDRTISVLVCSDGMSRGMDLASCRAVIHYDVPGMAKTYVHRCGRTARAGQDGTAIALLKGKGQAGQFARLRRLIALPERVTRASVKTSLVRDAVPLYKHCVSRLRDVLAAEDRNELKPTDPDLTRWLPTNERDSRDSVSDSDSDDSSTSASSMSLE